MFQRKRECETDIRSKKSSLPNDETFTVCSVCAFSSSCSSADSLPGRRCDVREKGMRIFFASCFRSKQRKHEADWETDRSWEQMKRTVEGEEEEETYSAG